MSSEVVLGKFSYPMFTMKLIM
ncbi:hypothetical protein LINPERPRIM_LOCUS27647 [Linum perenne]